ncbi:Panacea domain-containing protein [Bacillus cereus]|uniref:Panacea domain-containing protein n=1 Tax=Bacillus cereus TaxID=1396 RepID=UPI0035CAEAC8
MAEILDVAKYFILLSEPNTKRNITHLKLQKLVYYAHAWNLALYQEPLFLDDIEAWVHGPVIPELYDAYREYGYTEIYYSNDLPGNTENLMNNEIDIIEATWDMYGQYSGKYLENLTHLENPWINARQGQDYYDHGNNIIENQDIREYYAARLQGDN